MAASVDERLAAVHPQMLRADTHLDPQNLGRREIGQAFEWALDRAHVTHKDAAYRMGYSDQGVIGRWVSGMERVQLDKVRLLDDVYPEFLVALLQACAGVEIHTSISVVRRIG